jgi:DNA-binding transcriptional ArsR family regulator
LKTKEGVQVLLDVDRLIHEPARLAVMALLSGLESADFLYLLRETGLTKGNLSSHLLRLENGGYLTVEKTYRGKVPQTIYRLTAKGRKAWKQYRERLRGVIVAAPRQA